MDLETYVRERLEKQDADLEEIKHDVKELIVFMAVEKDRAKRSAIIAGGIMSFIISILVIAAERLIG